MEGRETCLGREGKRWWQWVGSVGGSQVHLVGKKGGGERGGEGILLSSLLVPDIDNDIYYK